MVGIISQSWPFSTHDVYRITNIAIMLKFFSNLCYDKVEYISYHRRDFGLSLLDHLMLMNRRFIFDGVGYWRFGYVKD